uniref:Uncharacterized protein TCIL3000_3_2290 n=1 Tax=Trypanosoma congolense (strain IL3000) TaxID=1068625 RepID=G0UK92_TRYCI|nr:unnamed protein product [Trypanosoma congolense IL3000]
MPLLVPCRPVRILTGEEFDEKLRACLTASEFGWPLPSNACADSSFLPGAPSPTRASSSTVQRGAITTPVSSLQTAPTEPSANTFARKAHCIDDMDSAASEQVSAPVSEGRAFAQLRLPCSAEKAEGATASGCWARKKYITGTGRHSKFIKKPNTTAGTKRQLGIEGFLTRKKGA